MGLIRRLIPLLTSIFVFHGCAVQDKSHLEVQWRDKAISLASACSVSWLSDQSMEFINGPSAQSRKEFIDHFMLDEVEGRKIFIAETAGLSDKFSIIIARIDNNPKIYYFHDLDNEFSTASPGDENYEHQFNILDFSKPEMICDPGTGVFEFYIILET